MIPVSKSGDIKVNGGYITQEDYVKIHKRAERNFISKVKSDIRKRKIIKIKSLYLSLCVPANGEDIKKSVS